PDGRAAGAGRQPRRRRQPAGARLFHPLRPQPDGLLARSSFGGEWLLIMAAPEAVHASAAKGFARDAEAYARGRPEYPVALDPWLRTTLGLGPARTVLDLGAGTGKLTRRLLATDAAVVAVEPVPEMLARLRESFPQVEARSGTAQAIPLADAT